MSKIIRVVMYVATVDNKEESIHDLIESSLCGRGVRPYGIQCVEKDFDWDVTDKNCVLNEWKPTHEDVAKFYREI